GPTRVPEYRSSHRCIHAWPISADGRPLNACIDAVAAAENIATLEQHSPVWAECRGECAAYIRLPQDGSAYRTAARTLPRHPRSRNTGRRRAREHIGPAWRLSGHPQVAARRVRPIEGRHRDRIRSVVILGDVQVRRHRAGGYVLAVMPGASTVAPGA